MRSHQACRRWRRRAALTQMPARIASRRQDDASSINASARAAAAGRSGNRELVTAEAARPTGLDDRAADGHSSSRSSSARQAAGTRWPSSTNTPLPRTGSMKSLLATTSRRCSRYPGGEQAPQAKARSSAAFRCIDRSDRRADPPVFAFRPARRPARQGAARWPRIGMRRPSRAAPSPSGTGRLRRDRVIAGWGTDRGHEADRRAGEPAPLPSTSNPGKVDRRLQRSAPMPFLPGELLEALRRVRPSR